MSTPCSVSLFLSYDSKQDAATTTAQRKSFIELFKKKGTDVNIKYIMGK